MNRPHFKAIFEHTMLLAALATGGLLTLLTPGVPEESIASSGHESATNHASAENPLLDTIGYDVDTQLLIQFGSLC